MCTTVYCLFLPLNSLASHSFPGTLTRSLCDIRFINLHLLACSPIFLAFFSCWYLTINSPYFLCDFFPINFLSSLRSLYILVSLLSPLPNLQVAYRLLHRGLHRGEVYIFRGTEQTERYILRDNLGRDAYISASCQSGRPADAWCWHLDKVTGDPRRPAHGVYTADRHHHPASLLQGACLFNEQCLSIPTHYLTLRLTELPRVKW